MDKNLYINDLIHRYSDHTFTETLVEDMTKVEFKNASSVVISEAITLVVIDAYRLIRNDVLNGEDPNFLTNTAQKNALTGIDRGTTVFDITLARSDCFNTSAWNSSAGIGVMSPSAYGNMFEDSATGSAMNPTTKEWIRNLRH